MLDRQGPRIFVGDASRIVFSCARTCTCSLDSLHMFIVSNLVNFFYSSCFVFGALDIRVQVQDFDVFKQDAFVWVRRRGGGRG